MFIHDHDIDVMFIHYHDIDVSYETSLKFACLFSLNYLYV